jgi:hypothetical protein
MIYHRTNKISAMITMVIEAHKIWDVKSFVRSIYLKENIAGGLRK